MNATEPFGLPRGSVRALLTVILVALSGVAMFVPVVDENIKSMVVLLTGIAVRDYFAVRKTQNDQDGPPVEPPAVNGE